jgi:hypothetical protein
MNILRENHSKFIKDYRLVCKIIILNKKVDVISGDFLGQLYLISNQKNNVVIHNFRMF